MKQNGFTPIHTLMAALAMAGLLATGSVQAQGYSGPAAAPRGEPHVQGPRPDTPAGSLPQTGGPRSSYQGPVTVHGYTGPVGAVSTVRELIDHGRDDQKAMLRGRIVSRDGRKHYTFDDGTAQIRVEISDRRFPHGQVVNDQTQVELFGEFERKGWGRVEFDVDMMRVL